MTETEWLPRADGYLLGQVVLRHVFTYNARANAGYAQLLHDAPAAAAVPADRRD